MRLFENWWERAPLYLRIGLFVASLVAMVVGGGVGWSGVIGVRGSAGDECDRHRRR